MLNEVIGCNLCNNKIKRNAKNIYEEFQSFQSLGNAMIKWKEGSLFFIAYQLPELVKIKSFHTTDFGQKF